MNCQIDVSVSSSYVVPGTNWNQKNSSTQFGSRSEVVLMLFAFLLSLSQKSRKEEIRGELQTDKRSGCTGQERL